jgi:hypothetical protein
MNGLLDVCWMPVEPQYAPEVQSLLQSLRARDGAEIGAAPAVDADGAQTFGGRRRNNDGGVVWADDEYDVFMAAGKESYRRVRAFADVLAGSPGERFTTTAACETAGISPTQLRAALGKFTTWMKATIDNGQWPFGWAYGDKVDPNNPSEFHYGMSREQAAAWRAAHERTSNSE